MTTARRAWPILLVLAAATGCGGDTEDTSTAASAQPSTSAAAATETTATPETSAMTAVETTGAAVAPEIPDTPVGEAVAWVLDAVNGGAATLTVEDVTARFAPVFLEQLPADGLITTAQQLAATGPYELQSYEGDNTQAAGVLRTPTGDVQMIISVEAEAPHGIDLLLFQPTTDLGDLGTWDEIEGVLPTVASGVGLLAAEVVDGECEPLRAVDEETPRAIGSAFKLFVLGELARQIESDTATWDEELAVRDDWKSLPSGLMQDEPAGALFSLRHYAEQMISISDNTATDHLIYRLGRLQVETMQGALGVWAPALNIPFVTTRELFILKLGPADLAERYLAASAEERRGILDGELAGVSPDLADAASWTTPRHIDTLEWFASSTDLCRTMAGLMELATHPGIEPVRDVLALNPGLALDPSVWTYAAFKGGSEPGVLSGTWLLERSDGRTFVFTLTLNDPTTLIADDVLVQVATAGIAQLATA